jgi:PII-like signaling protein
MRLQGAAQRLTIFIGEQDRYKHHSLSTEIVERARRQGLAGATVLRGIAGFGPSHVLHSAHLLSLSDDLPLAIVIVDDGPRIQAFLPQLDELIHDGLVIVDDVDVVRYVGRKPDHGHADPVPG